MAEEKRGEVGHESKNPYYEGKKYQEPTICSSCRLVYSEGRWTSETASKKLMNQANKALCPACKRKKDRNPEGVVYLSGDYFHQHRKEILQLAKNAEQRAQENRPLQQIMSYTEEENTVEITTTNEHLARRIGKAIASAHAGELDIKSGQNQRLVRIYWSREE